MILPAVARVYTHNNNILSVLYPCATLTHYTELKHY